MARARNPTTKKAKRMTNKEVTEKLIGELASRIDDGEPASIALIGLLANMTLTLADIADSLKELKEQK